MSSVAGRYFFLSTSVYRLQHVGGLLNDLTAYSKLHSNTIVPEGPSARALREPYPSTALSSSVFEENIFQTRARTATAQIPELTHNTLLQDAIRHGDFGKAESLRQELVSTGLPLQPSCIYLQAMKYAIENSTADNVTKNFVLWIRHIPEAPLGNIDDPSQHDYIMAALRWALAKIQDSNVHSVSRISDAAVAIMERGYFNLVVPRLLSLVIRAASIEQTLSFFQQLHRAGITWLVRNNASAMQKRDRVSQWSSELAQSLVLAGHREAGIETIQHLYTKGINLSESSVQIIVNELRRSGSMKLLQELTRIRQRVAAVSPELLGHTERSILQNCLNNNLGAAFSSLVAGNKRGITLPPYVLHVLSAATRQIHLQRQWHNLVHATSRRMRKNKAVISMEERTVDKGLYVKLQPVYGTDSSTTLEHACHRIREVIFRSRQQRIDKRQLATFMEDCVQEGCFSLLRDLRQEIFDDRKRSPAALWVSAEMLLQRRRNRPEGIVGVFQKYFFTAGVSEEALNIHKRAIQLHQQNGQLIPDELEVTTRLSPTRNDISQLWNALLQLSVDIKVRKRQQASLLRVYDEFLSTVRQSRGLQPPTASSVVLSPNAQFNAAHFTPFVRHIAKFVSRDDGMRIVADMNEAGVAPTLGTWTALGTAYASGSRWDVERLDQLTRALPPVLPSVDRVTSASEHHLQQQPNLVLYRAVIRALWSRNRRHKARELELSLYELGYRKGRDHRLDTVLKRLDSDRRSRQLIRSAKRINSSLELRWLRRYLTIFHPERVRLRRILKKKPRWLPDSGPVLNSPA